MNRVLRLLCLLSFALAANAQDNRATVSGQVTDTTGAAIPGAKVTAIQRSTNQATTQITNRDGFFTLTYMQPSVYDIQVEASGFKRAKRENLTLLVADKIELPFQLEIGEMTQEVTVAATAEILQTGDASGGQNFDSLQTSEYALNGRQVYMLMGLTPGVLFTQEQFGATGYSGTRSWDVSGAYVMNGGVSGTNSFKMDGAPVSLTGTWQIAPSVDAIQEFKVQTNTYDASMGRTGGGSVNTTLKSGTNSWHGTMYDFIRNSILDANYTQNNQVLPNGAPRGKHITHTFGGTIGGALRKDRDFIFTSFEGLREIVPFPVTATVPPADIYDGQHFSEYKVTIYDPATGQNCVSKVTIPGTCTSGFIRNPFPGDVIPQSRISPIGAKILSYYPKPNVAPATPSTFAQSFVYANSTGHYHTDQPIVKWDHTIDSNDRLAVTFTFQHGQEYRNQTGIPGVAASGNINTQRQSLNHHRRVDPNPLAVYGSRRTRLFRTVHILLSGYRSQWWNYGRKPRDDEPGTCSDEQPTGSSAYPNRSVRRSVRQRLQSLYVVDRQPVECGAYTEHDPWSHDHQVWPRLGVRDAGIGQHRAGQWRP